MKLKTLLNELTATQQAHRQGLKSRGYGYWEKNGQVVARTVGDKLVPVNRDEPSGVPDGRPVAGSAEKPKAKPASMSAQQAGTEKPKRPAAKDIEKTNGMAASDKEREEEGGGGEEGPAPVPPNPFRPRAQLSFGRPVTRREVEEAIPGPEDPFNIREEIIIGEEPIFTQEGELDDFLAGNMDSPGSYEELAEVGDVAAGEQDETWRRALYETDPISYEELLYTQVEWQRIDQYKDPEDVRIRRNTFLNSVGNGHPPAVLNIDRPIERGMHIDAAKLRDFLKDFRIGKNVDMVPSGFSSISTEARQFAAPGHGEVGVLLRLSPNKEGKIHGIALSGVHIPDDREDLKEVYKEADPFLREREIIRYSGPKARCAGVKKLIGTKQTPRGPRMMTVYVIDLEERGFEDDPPVAHVKEGVDMGKKTRNPVFDEIMNTSFGFWRRRKPERNSIKLRNMVKK